MSAAHTAGEWAEGGGAALEVYAIQPDGRRLKICSLRSGSGSSMRLPLAELLANGRLIARAPRLLRALRDVEPLFDSITCHPDARNIVAHKVAVARATLADLEGGK